MTVRQHALPAVFTKRILEFDLSHLIEPIRVVVDVEAGLRIRASVCSELFEIAVSDVVMALLPPMNFPSSSLKPLRENGPIFQAMPAV